jgi:hypothetical protein
MFKIFFVIYTILVIIFLMGVGFLLGLKLAYDSGWNPHNYYSQCESQQTQSQTQVNSSVENGRECISEKL